MTMRSEPRSKGALMHELLGQLGDGKITVEDFRVRLAEAGMTDDEIDLYLEGKLK